MSLIYLGASAIVSGCIDSVTDSVNNRVLTLHTDNSLRGYSLNTLLQTYVATGLTTQVRGMCVLNSASAVVMSNQTTVDYVELSTGYKQAVAGGVGSNTQRSQLLACDPASSIAMALPVFGKQVVKIQATPQTVSNTSLVVADINCVFQCIILKSPGRWLIGTNYGYVYEMDTNFNIVDQLRIRFETSVGTTLSVSLIEPYISNLSYADNLLTVGADLGVWVFDWTTKTQLKFSPASSTTTQFNTILSNMSSGICLHGLQTNNKNASFKELDIAIRPLTVRDALGTNANSSVLNLGINPITSVGWAIQSNNLLTAFTITPRPSTLRTFTAQIGGIDQKCRLSLIDDTGGAGSNFVCFDTIMQSPATYRVPTGKSIIEVKKVGEGTTALWSGSSYST